MRLNAADAFGRVEVRDHFRVARRGELARRARRARSPQLDVVVDLAVLRDGDAAAVDARSADARRRRR